MTITMTFTIINKALTVFNCLELSIIQEILDLQDLKMFRLHFRLICIYKSKLVCINQPELGSVSTPTFESLKRFLSPSVLNDFPDDKSTYVNDIWDYHKYIPYNTQVNINGTDIVYGN